MFTTFDDVLDTYARTTYKEQVDFQSGGIVPAQLSEMQLSRLQRTLRYVRERSPFYRKHLQALSDVYIDSLTFETFRDVPFTTKDHLREHLHDVLSQPLHKAWVYYETTGTTGPATPCPRNEQDSIANNCALTVCYEGIFRAHGERHVVAVLGPTELHSTGDTFGDVLRNLGHTVVKMWPRSPLVGLSRALELLHQLGVTAMVCTPGTAIALAKEARKSGSDTRAGSALRLILALGELVTPALLKNLGQLWGAKVYNCMYASQEASILAACREDQLLHTIPLNNYYEVVDPDSGRPVKEAAGVREGELVVTSLYQGSKPLVRYRTGDMVRLLAPGIGSYPSAVIVPLGRSRDRLRLNGRSVTGFDVESAVLECVADLVDYELVVDTADGEDRLTVQLEMADAEAERRVDVGAVKALVGERLCVSAEVTFRRVGAITSTGAMVSWKAARLLDLRTHDPSLERAAALALARERGDR